MDDHAQVIALETADGAASAPMPSSAPAAHNVVRHFRQTFLWPIYLLPIEGHAQVEDHCAYLLEAVRDSPWREVEDEFTGEPGDFQERHYNEFVTFLPPVQRFLYGQGRGRAVRKGYGESPIRVLRRSDLAAVRVTLSAASAPIVFDIAHVDLYFFYDIDVAMLALEVMCNDIALSAAQDAMFRLGRTYPAYWDADGSAGHCPVLVEWLAADGRVLSRSDYENRNKFLAFVCEHRSPCIAAHWEFVLQPLVPHYSDDKGLLRYRLLEYYRMPMMAYLAIDNLAAVTRADSVRLALSLEPGDDLNLPFSDEYAYLTRWLEPVVGASERQLASSTEDIRWLLAGLAIVAAVLGIGLAYLVYSRRKVKAFEPAVLANAYYYDKAVSDFMGGPGYASFEATAAFDSNVIDGAVNGAASLVRGTGGILRKVQSGLVRMYAAFIGLAVVGLLVWFFLRGVVQ